MLGNINMKKCMHVFALYCLCWCLIFWSQQLNAQDLESTMTDSLSESSEEKWGLIIISKLCDVLVKDNISFDVRKILSSDKQIMDPQFDLRKAPGRNTFLFSPKDKNYKQGKFSLNLKSESDTVIVKDAVNCDVLLEVDKEEKLVILKLRPELNKIWQLNIISKTVSLDIETDDYKEHYSIHSGPQGNLLPVTSGERKIHFTPASELADYKGGYIAFEFNEENETAVIHDKQQCEAEMEVLSDEGIVKLIIEPTRSRIELVLKTGITDCRLIKIDEDGGVDSDTSIIAATEAFPVSSGHDYLFMMSKPGFHNNNIRFSFGYEDTTIEYLRLKPKNRFKMSAMSMALPGKGQRYGDRRIAGAWYTALTIVGIAFVGWESILASFYKSEYDNYSQKYLNEVDADIRDAYRRQRDSARDNWKLNRYMFLGGCIYVGAVWTVNFIDPLIFSINRKKSVKEYYDRQNILESKKSAKRSFLGVNNTPDDANIDDSIDVDKELKKQEEELRKEQEEIEQDESDVDDTSDDIENENNDL